jgi:hypothetical protein
MNEMVDTFAKIILVDGIKEAVKEIAKKIITGLWDKQDRKAIAEAITSIQFATIKTRNFIEEVGYKKNEDLTKLWHDAMNKVIVAKIHDDLPEYLFQKAKFWGQPKDWLSNPDTLELVPKLNDLDEKCAMLLQRLK